MARKEGFWIEPSDAAAANRQFGSTRGSSPPAPEDGVRLMRAFFNIRRPAVREAVIELIAQLSAVDEQME